MSKFTEKRKIGCYSFTETASEGNCADEVFKTDDKMNFRLRLVFLQFTEEFHSKMFLFCWFFSKSVILLENSSYFWDNEEMYKQKLNIVIYSSCHS